MRSRLHSAVAAVLLLASLQAAADPPEELGQLRQEAAQLRQLLNRLDARIQTLESQSQSQGTAAGQAATPSAAPPPVAPPSPAPVAAPAAAAPAAAPATAAPAAAPTVTPPGAAVAPAAAAAAPIAAAPAVVAAAPAATTAALSPVVALKQNWSQIERGTAQQKVQSLLGEPTKVLQIDGNTVWYYTYPGIGRGSVFFNRDGNVSSSQSPSFGWGW